MLMLWLHGKVDADKVALLKDFAAIAAGAAEKQYKSGQGAEKLQYAFELVNTALQKQGLTFDAKQVRAAIEAAVLGLP